MIAYASVDLLCAQSLARLNCLFARSLFQLQSLQLLQRKHLDLNLLPCLFLHLLPIDFT